VPVGARNIRRVAVPTHDFVAMVSFLHEVLGLGVSFRDDSTIELSTSGGDQIQVMAPGADLYERASRGPDTG
jgi:hypothetical protein